MAESRQRTDGGKMEEALQRPAWAGSNGPPDQTFKLSFTGSHVGCEHGFCGACSVVVNGAVICGCLTLAVQTDGQIVETIEGAAETGRIKRLQEAFFERAALQCGFCTGGTLLTAAELLECNSQPTREEIRAYISGNYCRCTGYQAIVDAIEIAARGDGGWLRRSCVRLKGVKVARIFTRPRCAPPVCARGNRRSCVASPCHRRSRPPSGSTR